MRTRSPLISDLPAAPEDFVVAHCVKHPNDMSAWKLVARKFGYGTRWVHRRGIYWKAR